MTEPATTTPDPEFNIPASGEPKKPKQPDHAQASSAQQPGGGGAPGTGEEDTSTVPPAPPGSDGLQRARPGTIYSPGEGITEEEAERAARATG